MSSPEPLKTLPITLLVDPPLAEEKDHFFEALGWVRGHLAEPLGVGFEVASAPKMGELHLPKGPCVVVAILGRNWLLAENQTKDVADELIETCLHRSGPDGLVEAGGNVQLLLFFQGLSPDEEPSFDQLPRRLALKQELGQHDYVFECTFDTPDELRRLVTSNLMGVAERASRQVHTNKQYRRPLQFPKRLVDALHPRVLVYDAGSKKIDPISYGKELASSAMALALEGRDIEAEFQFLEALATTEDLYITWAWGIFLSQENRLLNAISAYREMIRQADALGDKFMVGLGFYLVANTLKKRGQAEGALFQIDEAIKQFEGLSPSHEKAMAYELRGDLLVLCNRTNLSFKAYQQASEVSGALKDNVHQAQLALKEGFAFQRMEFLSEAEQCFAKALQKLENSPGADPRVLARAYIQKGSLESQRKLYAMAERSYNRAHEIFQRLEDEEGIADITGYLAKVMLLSGEINRASLLLRCALALENSQHDMVGLGLNHMTLGVYKAQTGKRQETINQFKAAMACFEVAGDTARANIARHLLDTLMEPEA